MQSIKSIYFYIFTFSLCLILFQSITCCSSFVSTSIEDVLGGLADQRATLRVPSRRDPVRATFGGLSSVHPGKGLTGGQRFDRDTHRSDQCLHRGVAPSPSVLLLAGHLCQQTVNDMRDQHPSPLHPMLHHHPSEGQIIEHLGETTSAVIEDLKPWS
jgi:hypothetical protein